MRRRWEWLLFLKIRMNFTNNFFLRYKIKIRRIWFDLEVHNTRFEIVHIKAVNNLVVLAVSRWSDINNFPIQGAWKLGKAFESNIEMEGCQYVSWVVSYSDIVNMKLGHCDLFSRFLLCYYLFYFKFIHNFTFTNHSFFFI